MPSLGEPCVATLTEILILHGLLPIEALDTLLAGDPADEGAVRRLVDSGIITELQFAKARAAQANLPFVELLEYAVEASALALVSPLVCRRHEVLPIGIEGGRLVLAMVDPGNVFALDDVGEASRMRVSAVVAERSDLLAAIARFHRADDELSNLTTTLEEEHDSILSTPDPSDEASDDAAPIVRFVNLLVSQAIQDKASDIHIEPGEVSLRVRYRIDGVLHEMPSAPKSIQNGVISRLKIMADIDIAERRKPQDGRMSVSHGGRKIDLRDLSLLDHNYDAFKAAYSKPYGMILVTGPTGSGKSTTLYTTLYSVARPEINVITVEDPERLVLHPRLGQPPSRDILQLVEQPGGEFTLVDLGDAHIDPDLFAFAAAYLPLGALAGVLLGAER
ncbi:ATPase, T2SS/T4P/T4SS family [Cryobacterium flavum]|uniref:ATPase, T2SS/T4P/T4SS family n=1 Tax=Cryobacterium flavum TaxID=1424659 RepID=UPI003B8450BB